MKNSLEQPMTSTPRYRACECDNKTRNAHEKGPTRAGKQIGRVLVCADAIDKIRSGLKRLIKL